MSLQTGLPSRRSQLQAFGPSPAALPACRQHHQLQQLRCLPSTLDRARSSSCYGKAVSHAEQSSRLQAVAVSADFETADEEDVALDAAAYAAQDAHTLALDPAIQPSRQEQIARLLEQGPPSFEQLIDMFGFPLDPVQLDAIKVLLQDESLVISAPTGAGKTAIALAGTVAALSRGQRVIYTTPLKALSNQKLLEMRTWFGEHRVGLQTGDQSLNVEGDVVIMTTEILRNILYRSSGVDQAGRSVGSARLNNVGLLVLDEVHYLGDRDRGTVWEEVIISCLPHMRLLAMSATIANARQLGGWLSEVHGTCQTLVSDHRPVPLTWMYCHEVHRRAQLSLMDLTKASSTEPENGFLQPTQLSSANRAMRRRFAQRPTEQSREKDLSKRTPEKDAVLGVLAKQKMLPAIWFIFSRMGCDRAAQEATVGSLVSRHERGVVQMRLDALRLEQPEAVREDLVPALMAGVASHHAGCLPGWKALIEGLFQQGIIKVVFATATLAAGINMPARSTIISSTSVRRGADAFATITHNELLQMAGRAGRRGYDDRGYCIMVHNEWDGEDGVKALIAQGPEPLESQFGPGYGMALNLLRTRTLPQAASFVQKSFSLYLATSNKAQQMERWQDQAAAMRQHAKVSSLVISSDESPQEQMATLKLQQHAQRRALKKAVGGLRKTRAASSMEQLEEAGMPCVVALDLSNGLEPPEAAICMSLLPVREEHRAAAPPTFLCLTEQNTWELVHDVHLAGVLGAPESALPLERLNSSLGPPKLMRSWKQRGADSTVLQAPGTIKSSVLAQQLSTARIQASIAQLAKAADDKLAPLRAEIIRLKQTQQAMASTKPAAQLLKKAERLEARVQAAAQELSGMGNNEHWVAFERIVTVLLASGALHNMDAQGMMPATPLGLVARDLQAKNPLWLAMALLHPAVQDLDFTQLAAVMGALVTPEVVSRPGIYATIQASAAAQDAVLALEPLQATLEDMQLDAGLVLPLTVDLRLAGVVESWSAGASWAEIMLDCANADDGDIGRLLSRVTDLLDQAGHCLALPGQIRGRARKAADAMARAPIADYL